MSVEFLEYPDQAAMADAAAKAFVAALVQGVAARGQASFVASGGRTPRAVFERMAVMQAPWDQVSVTLSDERWVGPDEPLSNERFVRTTLLTGAAAAANFVSLKTDDPSPHGAEGAVHDRLAAMVRPFDVTVLGMGTDGHTASLFPGAEELNAALDVADPALCRAVTPNPLPKEAPVARISLTARALLASRRIALLLAGAEKRAIYDEAMAGADLRAAPVRVILKQTQTPVSVYWAP